MDRFGDLDVFARVAGTGSMSRAARELGLSPPVISKRIKRLEERLGTRLLQRTTRQIALTEAGRGFHERVLAILASVEEAEDWVSQRAALPRGPLRVSAPTTFGRLHVAPHLVRFLERYPEIALDLSLSDDFVDVIGGEFDVAIRIADLADTSLVARRLAPNHRVLCAAPAYLARNPAPATIADLARHRLLVHNADHWRLEGPEGPLAVPVRSVIATNSSEVIREAVIAGLGIALRSTWDVGPELRSGALTVVLPRYRAPRRVAIHAVYPSRRHLPQRTRVFIDFLTELYSPVPSWDRGLALPAG
ncbi:MAG: LysR family transcriptional regulator [Hyphomicrobiales bacterium]|uniref:LysR family transcriptional regulator n=1 Tax=Rhabdaerophilum calidifontis TaxID=2604328 RepID=UPI0012391DB2|nr:LysR family transcriptional regulator [Rhabdaerophilum calidifontis]MCA1953025.1 LysR family transcriptional regulator [Hyphomicrobiales bacterium]MCA1999678.1 LysR family transcriptional regulator [Hyphomicrobiales bacterium]